MPQEVPSDLGGGAPPSDGPGESTNGSPPAAPSGVAGATNGDIPAAQVDELAAAAGERYVVLVTGYGPGSATWIDGALAECP